MGLLGLRGNEERPKTEKGPCKCTGRTTNVAASYFSLTFLVMLCPLLLLKVGLSVMGREWFNWESTEKVVPFGSEGIVREDEIVRTESGRATRFSWAILRVSSRGIATGFASTSSDSGCSCFVGLGLGSKMRSGMGAVMAAGSAAVFKEGEELRGDKAGFTDGE